MKVFINKILTLITISLLVGSCNNDEDFAILNPDASTTISLSESTVVLNSDNANVNVLTINWSKPDFGFNASVNYQILFDLEGGDFSNAEKVVVGNVLSKDFETFELNKILRKIGIEAEVPTNVSIKVEAILSSNLSIKSNIELINATTFATSFEPIYMIGDAVLGWDTAKAVEVIGIKSGIYEVIAKFNNAGAFRFFEQANWDATTYNWTYFEGGSIDANFENAQDDDTNIRFVGTTGFYRINVNTKTKTITMEPVDEPKLFMVGAGVPDAGWGWDSPIELTWVKDGLFEATTTFTVDAFRFFTTQGDWGSGLNYPYYVGEDFTIDSNFEDAQDDDNNFKFIGTPGVYKIIVNSVTKTITLAEPGTAGPPKYIVGAGVPDAGWGWDSPIEMKQVSLGKWVATTTFAVDGFRFFENFGDWGSGTNYPYYTNENYTIDSNFEDALDDDNNFKFIGIPGTYTITLDSNSKTISLSN